MNGPLGGYALPIHDHQLESLTKQIATLEMKELNEKQRADHSDNKCKLLQVRKQKGTFEHFYLISSTLKNNAVRSFFYVFMSSFMVYNF